MQLTEMAPVLQSEYCPSVLRQYDCQQANYGVEPAAQPTEAKFALNGCNIATIMSSKAAVNILESRLYEKYS